MNNVIELVYEAFQYDFMLRALLVGATIALCSATLGVFLVLKKYAMIGDGLAHVSFATVALALLLQQSPILLSIPLVTIASVLILKLSESGRLHGDSAIGMVSSAALALGVIISSVAQGFNVDLFSYLFGSILVISSFEVGLSLLLALVVVVLVVVYYHDLFAITYDEEFAKLSGINVNRMNLLIAVLTSITIVLGIRVLGTMLISSMIIFPCVSALQLSKGFKATIVYAVVLSLICVIIGVLASFVLNFPSGATIVMVNFICFFFCYGYRKLTN
ncbi:MAG: metal ABC transporter permease [Erysipelotrichaceae bacterium]